MKNALVMVVGGALLAGMVSAGGCVSQKEFDDLKAMNRRVNEELSKCQDRLRLMESENQQLKGELADRDRVLKFKDEQIASLTAQNAQLRSDLQAAQAELAKLMGGVKPPPIGPLLPKAMNEALKKWAAENPEIAEYNEKTGMVRLKADLTFDPGSVTIKPAALAALKKLADILNTPEAKAFNVYVAGHTDDIPVSAPATVAKYEDNWGLSQGRAKAVVKILYGDKIEQERMGAMGFSKYHPIAPNAAGNKGNVLNRRVELWIVPNDLLLSSPSSAAPAPGGRGAPAPAGPETGD